MTTTMLGQGLYDVAEVARLVGHGPDLVVRWANPSATGGAIVTSTFDRYFSFSDLVSLRVASLVRSRGVSDQALRKGVETLLSMTGQAKPLASETVIQSLATSGRSFLSDWSGEFEDIGLGRQGVFQEVVRVQLARITFGRRGEPTRWEPADGVVIDPTIQAGAPCIAGTRVPTATVAGLLDSEDPEDVALDFAVSVEAILLADKFEQLLDEGAGVPA